MVSGRVVPWGNSYAIAVEKRVITEEELKSGQKVEVFILAPARSRKRKAALKKMFGMAKGAGPLEDYDED